jgi:hypothetical protein
MVGFSAAILKNYYWELFVEVLMKFSRRLRTEKKSAGY